MNKKNLEDKIEQQINIVGNTPDGTEREKAIYLVKFYALQYKGLTGDYYKRECKK